MKPDYQRKKKPKNNTVCPIHERLILVNNKDKGYCDKCLKQTFHRKLKIAAQSNEALDAIFDEYMDLRYICK